MHDDAKAGDRKLIPAESQNKEAANNSRPDPAGPVRKLFGMAPMKKQHADNGGRR